MFPSRTSSLGLSIPTHLVISVSLCLTSKHSRNDWTLCRMFLFPRDLDSRSLNLIRRLWLALLLGYCLILLNSSKRRRGRLLFRTLDRVFCLLSSLVILMVILSRFNLRKVLRWLDRLIQCLGLLLGMCSWWHQSETAHAIHASIVSQLCTIC